MIRQPISSLTTTPNRLAALVLSVGLQFAGFSHAETISWYSDQAGINQNSSGQSMDVGTVFELGVFSDGFTPEPGNIVAWDDHWQAAQVVNYNTTTNQFSASFTVNDNSAPFLVGTPGWIMARKTTATGTERLLFRRPGWLWPESNPMSPPSIEWRVNGDSNIQVVIGTVNPGGSPFLMRSEITRDYPQWQSWRLAGTSLSGPMDDPDQDGLSNLWEFVFDTHPLDESSRLATTGSFIRLNGEDYLQLVIPRKRTHLAQLAVQVSSDLKLWDEGEAFTAVVTDTASQWVVRDKIPQSAAPAGSRFMRLRAILSP